MKETIRIKVTKAEKDKMCGGICSFMGFGWSAGFPYGDDRDCYIEIGVEKQDEDEAFDTIKTTADNLVKSLARSLPEVGHKFKFNEDEGQLSEKFSWLISEKYGWEHNDEIEVVKHIENDEGEMVAVCLNTQPDVLNSACLTADFFETEAERNERERLEAAYDLYLTRHLSMPAPYRYDEFLKAENTLNGFLAIVDKTGYRKAVTNE